MIAQNVARVLPGATTLITSRYNYCLGPFVSEYSEITLDVSILNFPSQDYLNINKLAKCINLMFGLYVSSFASSAK